MEERIAEFWEHQSLRDNVQLWLSDPVADAEEGQRMP